MRALGVRGATVLRSPARISAVDAEVLRLADAYGLGTACDLEAVRRPVTDPRPRELNWPLLGEPPFSLQQAAAWAAPGWDWSPWRALDDAAAVDHDVLAEFSDPKRGSTTPAVVRRGNLVGCAFGLFAALVQEHTVEPYWIDTAQSAAPPRDALEAILLGVVEASLAKAGVTRARIMPWPAGIRWIRSIRHDYDRTLTRDAVAAVLAMHARQGSRATWYWRQVHAGDGGMSAVLRAGHEVALHTEKVLGRRNIRGRRHPVARWIDRGHECPWRICLLQVSGCRQRGMGR